MKYDLEKTVSTDQAFFFKTSCFGIKSFLLGTKTALHAFACGQKTSFMRNTVQSNQTICYAASVESRGFPGGVSPK